MRKSYEQLRDEISMDYLIDQIRQKLLEFKDPRTRSVNYSFHDLVMSAYAMFHFKYPSMNQFENQTASERANLTNLFKIENLCSDSHLRNILDQIDPSNLNQLYPQNLHLLKKVGVLREYSALDKYLICSVDGVQYFSSNEIHCENCLCKQHKNGQTTYHHSMLCAALVHPGQREVFLMGASPIKKQDGQLKNDCELNAAKRLLDYMEANYSAYKLLVVEDALYSNGPHLRRILANKWQFVVNIKPKGNKTLFKAFEQRKRRNSIKYKEITDVNGTIHRFWFDNNFPLNETCSDVRVNVLMYEEQKKNGAIKKFSWATSIKLTRANVEKIMRIGRARWKIENETFNTLKNQGYEFDHNFGHGFNHLSTFLAYLMLLAFQTDQVFQRCNHLFNKIWEKAKTKAKLWTIAKSIFSTKVIYSFKELYLHLAYEFEVTLEPT